MRIFIVDTNIVFSAEFYFKSLELIRDIDTDDLAFVSLTEYMDALLWTGDKHLELGLKAKGYKKVLNFNEVRELLKQAE